MTPQANLRRRSKSESSTANGQTQKHEKNSRESADLNRSNIMDSTLSPPNSPAGSSRNHSCLITDGQINFLAERTTTDWERILRHLGVQDHQIDIIRLDNLHSSYERAYQGYKQWKRNEKDSATTCAILDVLSKVGKDELRKEMEHMFSHKTNQQTGKRKSLYMASVKHFVGRKDDLKVIHDFLDKTVNIPYLLCVNGLPGSGKKELIIEALNRAYGKLIEPSQIIKPNFMIEDKEEWSFDDLLQCILKELQKFVPYISGNVNVLDLLNKLSKPCVLILEIAHLNLQSKIFNKIWLLIHDVLRNNKNNIKIIATSCRHPDGIICGTIECVKIHLGDLSLEESTELLNRLCSSLDDLQIKNIYKCVGGNPSLLRKISARINSYKNQSDKNSFINSIVLDEPPLHDSSIQNNFAAHEKFYRQESHIHETLYILVKSSTWWRDMTCVFKMMHKKEKKLLAYLSSFHGKIPRSSLCSIFQHETDELKNMADDLCMNHCILQKIDKDSCFLLTEFYKTFIIKHIAEEGYSELAEIRNEAKMKITKFYVKLLVDLAKFSISKARKMNSSCDSFVHDYRQLCDKCTSHCECANFAIAKAIFMHHKVMIYRSLNKIMSFEETDELFKAPYDLVVFLRHVLTLKELTQVYDQLWHLSSKNQSEKAVTQACLVFIKIHAVKKYKDEQKIYLIMLNQSIEVLETLLDPTQPNQEFLLACYLKKAYILARFFNDYISAELEMEKAEEIFLMPKIRKGKFPFHGTEADILHGKKEFRKANNKRLEQVKRSKESLGNHPFTAKALYLHSKNLEKIIKMKNTRLFDDTENIEKYVSRYNDDIQKAYDNYQDSIYIYHKLDSQYDVGKVCSSFGRFLKSRKRIEEAQNIFEYGVHSVLTLRNTCKNETSYLYRKCTNLARSMDQMSSTTTDDESFIEANNYKQKKCLKVPQYCLSKRRSIMFMFFNPRSKMFYIFITFLFFVFMFCTFHETKPGHCIL